MALLGSDKRWTLAKCPFSGGGLRGPGPWFAGPGQARLAGKNDSRGDSELLVPAGTSCGSMFKLVVREIGFGRILETASTAADSFWNYYGSLPDENSTSLNTA